MSETPPTTAVQPSPEQRIAAARAAVARETRRARRAMTLEALARALWPLWALAAAFLGLALLGLPQSLPFWGHVAVLAGFAAAAVWLGHRAVSAWRSPTASEALARLDAGAPGRPAAAVGDALAAGAGDARAQALWAAHQARMAERAAQAKAAPADLRVSAQDRFALRHAAGVALAAGLLAQIGDGGARLSEALSPVAAGAATVERPAPSVEAWVSPPPHTGVAPLYLTERAFETEAVALPANSQIALRVFDATEPPALTGEAVDAPDGFAEQGPNSFAAGATLMRDGALSVTLEGGVLAEWRFAATPDAAPSMAFSEPPVGARSGALQFAFAASDDYGVVAARAGIAIDAGGEAPEGLPPADTVIEPIAFELPLPLTGDAREVAESVVQDLIAHPWAGLPVRLTLTATDGAGQEGVDSRDLVMPARPFRDPLARALIEQRRHLAWSVGAAERVHRVLVAVTAYPEDVFEDTSAYLTTRLAVRRLGFALEEGRVREEAEGVIELLWEAALRIEDGDLSDAERRLRELQERLSEAIEEGAPQDEIAELMQQLREALRDFMQQLAQEALRDQANGQELPEIDPDQMMTQQDLEDMLQQLEDALRNGMEDLARQMLQQLQQMLENLQMAQPGQQQGGGQGDQAMQELQDMIGRQQGLADRSFEALREGRQPGQGQPGQGRPGEGQPGQGRQGQGQQGQGQQGQGQQGQGQQGQAQGQGQGEGQGGQGQGEGQPGGLGSIARDQEELRRMLDQLRQGLPGEGREQGGSAEALGRAEERMGSARDALEQGDAEGALQDQVDALDALREGAQQLAQEMQQGQPGQAQQAGRNGRSGDVRDEDPFGRPTATDGPLDGDSVRVPDAGVMKRARELMDEIRRRAGDRTRDSEELEYLQRLLDRF
ncbi:MAG: TIGR02302 family protein [Rubrimonas sp.]|uniref:TIGR02302 family protein n=1 Tax=Rubrimonas sp. TaxID=2036015 RepID=UPI002FDC7BEE